MVTRVVVCYTGGVGSQVIRLLAGDPAFQVAGVLVHHEEKEGATPAISPGSTHWGSRPPGMSTPWWRCGRTACSGTASAGSRRSSPGS